MDYDIERTERLACQLRSDWTRTDIERLVRRRLQELLQELARETR